MRLAGQKDAFGRRCQVGAVLFRQFWDGEGVPAESVGIANAGLKLATDRGDPDQMQARGDQGHVPERGVVEGESKIGDYCSWCGIPAR